MGSPSPSNLISIIKPVSDFLNPDFEWPVFVLLLAPGVCCQNLSVVAEQMEPTLKSPESPHFVTLLLVDVVEFPLEESHRPVSNYFKSMQRLLVPVDFDINSLSIDISQIFTYLKASSSDGSLHTCTI